MKNKIYILLVILLGISKNSLSQEVIDLFIWAGQSNAQGWTGDANFYPADPNYLDCSIRLNYTYIDNSSSDGWIIMQPQIGRYTPQGHFGPEVTFSRKLKQAGYNPAIFKYTKGATSLYGDWKSPGAGGFYDDMVTDLIIAIADLENQGHIVNVKGFVWIQGESDGDNAENANAYEANLLNLIYDLRNNVVNNSALPIVLGVDEQHPWMINQPEVVNAHINTALGDNNIEFTSMIGLPKADITHLTPAGLETHGEIIYMAYNPVFCSIKSAGSSVSSLIKESWGQSFEANCSGPLKSVTFNAATALSSGVSLSIKNGKNCNSTEIYKQSIGAIIDGNNTINISGNVSLREGRTYYMHIMSDIGETFRIRFNHVSQVKGNIRTYLDDTNNSLACDWRFRNFDLDFSVEIGEPPIPEFCSIKSAGSSISSLVKESWGQSFEANCSGPLKSVTFNAATALSSGVSLSIKNGKNCNSTEIYKQSIGAIIDGNNTINISENVPLREGKMYYIHIMSDIGETFRIRYNEVSQVKGNLRTYLDITNNSLACDWKFPNFDLDFSVEIEGSPNSESCSINSTGPSVSGLIKESWGQSFEADCSGNIKSVTFNAATALCSGVSLSIKDGNDCNSTEIYTQSIGAIVDGNNTVTISGNVPVTNGNMYYIHIMSNNAETFRIRFNHVSQVKGNLRTYLDATNNSLACDWNFPEYDLDFSIEIGESLNSEFSPTKSLKTNMLTLDNKVQPDLFDSISIYPNPSQGRVNINLGELRGVSLKILNMNGQLVHFEKNINSSNHQFDLEDASPGIYILYINYNEHQQIYRLMLK